jgi:nucleotide-binding universal stress UspA family protein
MSTNSGILCITDLSGDPAQPVATAIASAWQSSLTLVSLNAGSAGGDESALGFESLQHDVSPGAAADVSLPNRKALAAITEYIRTYSPGLVVISGTANRPSKPGTHGSLARELAETAAIPTLIVQSPAPVESWSRGERALQILVAVDFTEVSAEALRWVARLQAAGRCDVTAVFLDRPEAERERLGISGPRRTSQNLAEVQQLLERDLREHIRSAIGENSVQVQVCAAEGEISERILALAGKANADLIVVGTHRHWSAIQFWHHSVSRGVIDRAMVNVLCVPPAANSALRARPCRCVAAAADSTPHGGFGIPYAYSVVNDQGKVCIVHVVNPRETPAAAHLQIATPPEAVARGITTETKIVEDANIARGICHAAEELNADLVCVGAHAHPGVAAKVMGSVALGVLQHCRRPVLVVWPPAE